jgi:PAS domain S-box-containing protein
MLLEENILLESIMDYCQDMITVKDLNFNYIACNRAFLKFMGLPHESYIIGKNITDLPIDSEIIKNNLEQVLNNREPQMYTFKIAQGVVSELSTPIVENGEITGILSITKDITLEENLKLKLVDKICELNETLDKKRQLEAQKELFLTTLTHDLKNPVQAQLMSLKLFKNKAFGEINSEQNNMLDILLESSEHMLKMLYSILRTYKYDNGKIRLNKKLCNIGQLIQNCVNEVSSLAKDKNIQICCNYKLCEINIDEEQIRRVIENLINNALNYSYKNSQIIIKFFKDKKFFKFEISNTGIPIPKDVKEHMFEKYSTSNGIGLGLYFSKKIVEAHRGTISLKSEGELCTFSFELPTNLY